MELTRLFQPLQIKGLRLENRLVMPALHHQYTPEGYATERFNEYYWRRAEGGVGLIIVGGCAIDGHVGYAGMMSLANDSYIEGYRQFTDGIHERGGKVAVQMMQTGRYGRRKYITGDTDAIAPSAVFSGYTRETPREMTRDEIREIIEKWAAAAVRAKKAGFDAVESTGASGYLISQFLSPVTNLRQDEYGGSWENRCRFAVELVHALRKAVGPDYPLIMRVAGNEFIKGGNTNEECVAFCKLMEEAGIDMINVTGGWHETTVPQLPGIVPRGEFSYLAQAVKDAVSIPVMASNRFNEPLVAERTLALNQADLIGIGRPLIADPDYPKKAKEQRCGEIRRCVSCNQGCLGRMFFDKPVQCLVNGMAGREFLFKNKPEASHQRLAVIGAGPAGCEFSIRAAENGHDVILFEKNSRIGGKLPLISVPFSKKEFETLMEYYSTMLEKRGVHIVLNHSVTEEEISRLGFDAVIISTGSDPVDLPLSLPKDIMKCNAEDILQGSVLAGQNVLVIGGGAVGCEAAEFMAHEGSLSPDQLYFKMSQRSESPEKINALLNSSRRNISVIDLARIGTGFDPGCFWPLQADLKRLGVHFYSNTSLEEICDGKAVLKSKDKKTGETKQFEVPCDTVVIAVGYRENNSLYNKLKEAGVNVYLIGDAFKAGKVLDAVRQADDLSAFIDGYEVPACE